MLGRSIDDPTLGALVDEACLAPLAPIDDIRASGAYRLDAVRELLARSLAGRATTGGPGATVGNR